MRISDWSSDVCSSDLRRLAVQRARDQFLAGDGLAGDQHRQRRLREPANGAEQLAHRDRKSGVAGTSVSGRVDLGGGRTSKKKKKHIKSHHTHVRVDINKSE